MSRIVSGDFAQSLTDLEFVTAAFRTLLARDPQAPELAAGEDALRIGMSRQNFLLKIVQSAELHHRLVSSKSPVAFDLGLDNASFLSNLYREVLHREIDDSGRHGGLIRLSNGTPRELVVHDVVASSEFLARLKVSTPALPARKNLLAMRPEQFFRRGEFLVFRVRETEDYDWLEQQIFENHYYESPGAWGYDINFDKRVMAEFLSVFAPSRGLEIGCGTGAVIECLQNIGFSFDGLEISEFSIARSFPAVRNRIHQGDLLSAAFPADAYDLVVGLDVFEHLNPNKLGSYVERVRHILTMDGFFVINVPAFGDDDVFGTVHSYWLTEWRATMETHRMFDIFPVDQLGYPLMGHLVWADSVWWETQLLAWGFSRQREVERALHATFDRAMETSPARRSFFVFQKIGADARRSEFVTRNIQSYDIGRIDAAG